jgi:membrane protein implicated in regulation of membrane protease activity
MIIYLSIAGIGVVLLVLSWVFGEVFDFLEFDIGLGDGPGTTSVIAIGLTAFGAAGGLATYAGWSTLLSALTGGVAAVTAGALGAWLLSAIYRQSGGTDDVLPTMRGRAAQVTTTIPAQGLGEVMMSTADATRHVLARSSVDVVLNAGTVVKVVDVIGNTVIVEPMATTSAPVENV